MELLAQAWGCFIKSVGCNSRWDCSAFSRRFMLNRSWFKREKNNVVSNKQDGDGLFDLSGSFLLSLFVKEPFPCRKMSDSGTEMPLPRVVLLCKATRSGANFLLTVLGSLPVVLGCVPSSSARSCICSRWFRPLATLCSWICSSSWVLWLNNLSKT